MTRRETLVILLLIAITFAARLLPGPRTIDDAYITFRYARNILAGNGFVYNIGERVLGTTTPLYTLLMTAEAWLSGRRDASTGLATGFPELALLTNAIADCVSVWMLYRLGKRFGNRSLAGIALAAVWAVHPRSVTFAVGGMETSVFVALILGTCAAYLDGRWRATGALAALALLTRPEALIAIVLLVSDVVLRVVLRPVMIRVWRILGVEPLRSAPVGLGGDPTRSRQPQPANPKGGFRTASTPAEQPKDGLAVFALLLTPWLVFATLYFGDPVPGSIVAKGVAYQLSPEHALLNFVQAYVVPFSSVGSFSAIVGLLLIATYTTLFAMGALNGIRSDSRAWPMFGFVVMYIGAYVIANPLVFRWYVVPPLPIFLLGITLGWNALASALKRPRLAATLFGAGAIVAVASAVGGWWIPDHGPALPSPRMAYMKIELTYLEAAERLKGEITADTVIAAGDIGAIGYAAGARIYDTLGLITAEARQYYPVPREAIVPPLPYAIPTRLILDAQPDILVILEAYGRNTFLRDPEFQARYRLTDTLVSEGTRDYSSEGMLIFKKQNEQ